MQFLNGFYIGKTGSEFNYYSDDNGTKLDVCTKESLISKNIKPLTNKSFNYIDKAIWTAYAIDSDTFNKFTSSNVNDAYLQERGITKNI